MSTAPPPKGLVAEAALVAIAAVWGLTFVMVQDAVERISVMTFLAYRFIPAGILIGLFARRRLLRLGLRGLRAGTVMGAFLTGGYVFQTLGLERTSAANAGFITGLFVVLTPVFGAVLLRQAVGAAGWVAAGVSALGLFLVSGSGGGVHLVGDVLVFVCACSFAFHILATDSALRKGFDLYALVALQLLVCGVFCLAVAAAQGDLEVPRSAEVWSALVVTSLFASAAGFLVQTYAQRKASPARTALILASEPAFAGFFAYVLNDEKLSSLDWVGALLILGAVTFAAAQPYLRPVRPLPEG